MVLVTRFKQMGEILDELEEDMENVRRVISYLREKNGNVRLILHPKSRNSEKAAREIGVEISQIVKSIVFVTEKKDGVLVLACGDLFVDSKKVKEIVGSTVRIAEPQEVKELTGYKVGAVSPFDISIRLLVDEHVMEKEEVQPAAGSTCVGALLSTKELLRLTGGEVVAVC